MRNSYLWQKLLSLKNEESFREKVSTLRESYFSTKPEAPEVVTEDVQVENAPTGDAMSVYVQALSRWGK